MTRKLTCEDRYEGVCMFPSPLHLISGEPTQSWSDARGAPPLRDTNSMTDRETRVRPVDIHFLKAGQQLLAAYLVHGIA